MELSLSQLSLEVVDWNGMDIWWGLGEEMFKLKAEDQLEDQEGHG